MRIFYPRPFQLHRPMTPSPDLWKGSNNGVINDNVICDWKPSTNYTVHGRSVHAWTVVKKWKIGRFLFGWKKNAMRIAEETVMLVKSGDSSKIRKFHYRIIDELESEYRMLDCLLTICAFVVDISAAHWRFCARRKSKL